MLYRTDTVLVVIDVQERLSPVMVDESVVCGNVSRLVEGFELLGVPAICTEQYPKGLGHTISSIPLNSFGAVIEKTRFSCCGVAEFDMRLSETARQNVVICGIEAHVCVYLTVLGLLGAGYQVHVVADAVSSRSARNCEVALQRMRDEGAKVCTTEMVLFELLAEAGGDDFKAMLNIVK